MAGTPAGKGGKRLWSLAEVALAREIKELGGGYFAGELASKGFTTPSGAPYSASAVASMLD